MAGVSQPGKQAFQTKFDIGYMTAKVEEWEKTILSLAESATDKKSQGEVRAKLSDWGLAKFCGCSTHTVERMRRGEKGYEEFPALFTEVISFREYIVSMFLDFGVGWVFTAKQVSYGGWQDVQKSESKSTQKIEITLNGVDGKPVKLGKS